MGVRVKNVFKWIKQNPRTTFCMILVLFGVLYTCALVVVRPANNISQSNCGPDNEIALREKTLPYTYEHVVKNTEISALSLAINGSEKIPVHTIVIEREGEQIAKIETENSVNTINLSSYGVKKADAITVIIDNKSEKKEQIAFCVDDESEKLQISEHFILPRYSIYWYAPAFFVFAFLFWGLAREEDNEGK